MEEDVPSLKENGEKGKAIEVEMEKRLWKDFYESVTLHGFHYIFDQKGWRKIGWLLIIIAASILSFYLFFGIIFDYREYKTLTIRTEDFNAGVAHFPTITICNFNSITKKGISKSKYNEEVWKIYNEYRSNLKIKSFSKKLSHAMSHLNATSIQALFKMFELQMEDMLNDTVVKAIVPEACIYDGTTCYANNFTDIYTETYGLCHQFNSILSGTESLDVSFVGKSSGLRLFLNIHTDYLAVSKQPFQGIAINRTPVRNTIDGYLFYNASASTRINEPCLCKNETGMDYFESVKITSALLVTLILLYCYIFIYTFYFKLSCFIFIISVR